MPRHRPTHRPHRDHPPDPGIADGDLRHRAQSCGPTSPSTRRGCCRTTYTGSPAEQVGDTFVIHMDREALNDFPLGKYDATVQHHRVRARPGDRVGHIGPTVQVAHFYGYRLEPGPTASTNVTAYYDGRRWATTSRTASRSSPSRRCAPPSASSSSAPFVPASERRAPTRRCSAGCLRPRTCCRRGSWNHAMRPRRRRAARCPGRRSSSRSRSPSTPPYCWNTTTVRHELVHHPPDVVDVPGHEGRGRLARVLGRRVHVQRDRAAARVHLAPVGGRSAVGTRPSFPS